MKERVIEICLVVGKAALKAGVAALLGWFASSYGADLGLGVAAVSGLAMKQPWK